MKKYLIQKDNSLKVGEPSVAYNSSMSNVGLQVIHDARNGIKTDFFLRLGDSMALSLSDMSKILNISLRTLQRYEPTLLLDADASSKVIQLIILNRRGIEIFGDQLSFNVWLRSPISELEGSTPLALLDTPFGYQILHQILGRIEHGVFA